MSRARIILTTVASAEAAHLLARALVEARLAACVNIIDGVKSVYRWGGEIQDDREVLLIVKTVDERMEELQSKLLELHPYELPELVVLDPAAASERYLSWLDAETAPPT